MYVETVPPPGAGAGGGGGGGDGGGAGGAGPGGPGGLPAAEAVHLEEASHKGNGRILEIGVVVPAVDWVGFMIIYPHARVLLLVTHIPSRYITASAAIGKLSMSTSVRSFAAKATLHEAKRATVCSIIDCGGVNNISRE